MDRILIDWFKIDCALHECAQMIFQIASGDFCCSLVGVQVEAGMPTALFQSNQRWLDPKKCTAVHSLVNFCDFIPGVLRARAVARRPPRSPLL